MEPTRLRELPESLVEWNRAKYREEIANGIHRLMEKRSVKRIQMADLLGVQKSRITHLLSAGNLGADTIADALLVLGRTPHLTMAEDFDVVRWAIDETESKTTRVTVHTGSEHKVYARLNTIISTAGGSTGDTDGGGDEQASHQQERTSADVGGHGDFARQDGRRAFWATSIAGDDAVLRFSSTR